MSPFKKGNLFLQQQSITEDDSIIMCGDLNCKLDNLKKTKVTQS